jgi:hypothetical protein
MPPENYQATSFIFMTFSNSAQVNPLKRPAVVQNNLLFTLPSGFFFSEIIRDREI